MEKVADEVVYQSEETEEEKYQRLEAELRAEAERETDRRITQALKKARRKFEAEEEIARAMEKGRKQKAYEEWRAANIEKARELDLRGIRLDLVDLIADNELPKDFRVLIPYADLLETEPDPVKRYLALKDRVRDTWVEFRKQVRKAVAEERAKFIK